MNTSNTTGILASGLHRALLELGRALRGQAAPQGLSAGTWLALGVVYRHRQASSALLARELKIKPQSLTKLLAQLEEKELIARQANARDKRRQDITLTAAGRKVFTGYLKSRRLHLQELIEARLSAEEQQRMLGVMPLLDKLIPARD